MAPLRLKELWLDEAMWTRGSAARRVEWRAAIRDFIETAELEAPASDEGWPSELTSCLTLESNGLRWSLGATVEEPRLHLALPRPRLQPIVDEYMQICVELGRPGQPAPRVEALDIAKRLVHNEGGEVLVGLASPLGLSHETGRRLFTVVVTVLVDTTVVHIPPHRAARPGRVLG